MSAEVKIPSCKEQIVSVEVKIPPCKEQIVSIEVKILLVKIRL